MRSRHSGLGLVLVTVPWDIPLELMCWAFPGLSVPSSWRSCDVSSERVFASRDMWLPPPSSPTRLAYDPRNHKHCLPSGRDNGFEVDDLFPAKQYGVLPADTSEAIDGIVQVAESWDSAGPRVCVDVGDRFAGVLGHRLGHALQHDQIASDPIRVDEVTTSLYPCCLQLPVDPCL